ncbi:MAG: hypothetical protein LBE06_05665 [Azoarcus sp.]|jgi:hypothetical protein|nr:hypothetical protein [Azoarcus sp.]
MGTVIPFPAPKLRATRAQPVEWSYEDSAWGPPFPAEHTPAQILAALRRVVAEGHTAWQVRLFAGMYPDEGGAEAANIAWPVRDPHAWDYARCRVSLITQLCDAGAQRMLSEALPETLNGVSAADVVRRWRPNKYTTMEKAQRFVAADLRRIEREDRHSKRGALHRLVRKVSTHHGDAGVALLVQVIVETVRRYFKF